MDALDYDLNNYYKRCEEAEEEFQSWLTSTLELEDVDSCLYELLKQYSVEEAIELMLDSEDMKKKVLVWFEEDFPSFSGKTIDENILKTYLRERA